MEVGCEKFMLVHCTLFCYIIHKLYMGLWKAVCIMVAGLPVQCSDSLWCCVSEQAPEVYLAVWISVDSLSAVIVLLFWIIQR